jgi:hypothetical protein
MRLLVPLSHPSVFHDLGSSLISVGEDEIQRNNQEIRESGKEREECGLSTSEGIAVAHPWI